MTKNPWREALEEGTRRSLLPRFVVRKIGWNPIVGVLHLCRGGRPRGQFPVSVYHCEEIDVELDDS